MTLMYGIGPSVILSIVMFSEMMLEGWTLIGNGRPPGENKKDRRKGTGFGIGRDTPCRIKPYPSSFPKRLADR
jgi:hypothetical protein